MENKGIIYISGYIWIVLLLFAVLVQKGTTTLIGNVSGEEIEFITFLGARKLISSFTPCEIIIQTLILILILIFVSRYLILSPYKIFEKVWQQTERTSS